MADQRFDGVKKGRHGASVNARSKAGVEASYPRTRDGKAPWSFAAYQRARDVGAEAMVVRIDEILERDQGRCYLCDQPVPRAEISIDHIIPLALGGSHTPANLALTHRSCNARKGSTLTDKRPAALR